MEEMEKQETEATEETEAEAQEEATEEAAAEEQAEAPTVDAEVKGVDFVDEEARGEHQGDSGSYTAVLTDGTEVQIVKKESVGDTQVLTDAAGKAYIVAPWANGALEPYKA